ncbi:hypothetical protein OKW21_001372 [Catalinimonas alkaloidigena]|uniref:hypothetical protein n=1 Tax=Catalinimonas alkaloidigena TaxID=1075417 RepID=UPI002405ABB2|nr:hypothetical protein [Catalinimonas alkaloidigena]MDF9796109.1 hypothetical protein [Catalinimonas alkaloidigena]
MRKSLLISCLLSAFHFLSAQTPASYSIQKGEIITERIPYQDQYRFESFRKGTVLFAKGNTASSRLNYNYLYSEIQFIDVRGDTLSIAPEPLVRYVFIGDHAFYYHPDYDIYLEAVYESQVLSLLIYKRYQVFDRNTQMIKGYVDANKTFYENFVYEQDNRIIAESLYEFYNLPSLEDLRISYQENYFFVDKNIRFYPAVRSSLWKIFPQYRQSLRDFISKNKTNFSKEEDLKALILYCQQFLEQ